ncbi:FAD/NAD(P)-binding domain-containing protein [Hortaea werneckii]|nr:FAD/NAD(P)-binding domain-containing protein [Hortaea werneckii]
MALGSALDPSTLSGTQAESGLWPSLTGVREMIFTCTPFLSLRVLAPGIVEFAEIWKHDHRWKIARHAVLIRRIPHPVRGTRAKALKHHCRDFRGVIASSQKQGDHGKSYNVGKLFTEAPHLDQVFDWQQSEENLEHPHDLDHGEKPLDFTCVLCQKLCGVDVGPEVLILPKADLKVDRVGLVPVPCKHSHRVVKDRNRVCLAATVVDRIDESDIEFRGHVVWYYSTPLEPIGAIEANMLTCCTRADDEDALAPLAAILFNPFGHVETALIARLCRSPCARRASALVLVQGAMCTGEEEERRKAKKTSAHGLGHCVIVPQNGMVASRDGARNRRHEDRRVQLVQRV